MRERDALKLQLESSKQQISTLKNDYKALLAGQLEMAESEVDIDVVFCPAERSHAATSSRTVPSQHDSLAPPSLHTSQQHHTPHHRSHSQSAPHAAAGGGHHRPRERGSRLEPDESHTRGRYVSHAPISHHHSPSHHSMHSHSSPKRSSRYPAPHSTSHIHRGEPRVGPVGGDFHMYAGKRRSSDETVGGMWKANGEPPTDQRRKSAEPLTGHNSEKDSRVSREHHSSNRQRQAQSQPHSSHEPRSKTSSGSIEDLLDPSQTWETPDITILLNDEDRERCKSASSSSTLIDSAEEGPVEGVGGAGESRKPTKVHLKQHLSQEAFEDDEDHKEMMMSLAVGPTQIPLSNYPHYYESSSYFGEHQENYHPQTSKHDLAHGLSQPTYPSPPKSRHGKSLTDLTGSNMSLTSSHQFLSQSAVDFHVHDMHPSSRHHGETRRMHDHRFRPSYGKLQHMASDSHLNYIPGLQKSVLSALSDVKEEVEQKNKAKAKKSSPSSSHLQRAASQQYHTYHPQHKAAKLNQRHLKATVVKGNEDARESPQSKR